MDQISKRPSIVENTVISVQKPPQQHQQQSIPPPSTFTHDDNDDDDSLKDIKREAITITTNIVECAKNELSKKSLIMPVTKKLSVEISDEDMVERGDIEEIKDKLLRSGKRSSKSPTETTPTIETIKPIMEMNVASCSNLNAKISSSTKSGLKISPSREEIKEIMMSSSESSQPLSEQYRTPSSSRPQSSEYDMIIIPETMSRSGSHVSSEYVTCPTMTRDSSSFHTVPSQELTSSSQYYTPQSNLSAKSSSQSVETVGSSSSNIGDLSETSETIVHEDDDDRISPMDNDDVGNYFDDNYRKIDQIDTTNVEPFNYDVPSSMLKNDIDDQQLWLTKPTASSTLSSSTTNTGNDRMETTADRSRSYYIEPYDNPEPISMTSFYTQKTITTTMELIISIYLIIISINHLL